MKHAQHRSGAVLIFALVIMGMITVLTQQLINSVSVGVQFSHAMIAREQAEMLALAGMHIGIAQLGKSIEKLPEKEKRKKVGTQKEQEAFSFKAFITQVVPHLGRWQTFELTDEYDGIQAEIKVCITAEQGKVPYKKMFDEPLRDMSTQGKELFKDFGFKKVVKKGALLAPLVTHFKKRTHQLQDITELAPVADTLKLALLHESSPLALQDLFTLWPEAQQINPLVLSASSCALLGLRLPEKDDAAKRADRYKQLAEQYDKVTGQSGEEMWKSFTGLYDTKPKISKELMALFSPAIEPCFYSVLCCATVAGVTQQLLAIIERVSAQAESSADNKKNKKPATKKITKESSSPFKVRRLYWI